MEPTQKYDAIISAINMVAIYYEVSKKSRFGAHTELNYAAMIISVFIRYVERIPTIKDLIKRLNDDIAFKLNCGFLVSDNVPSEASYSGLLTKLSESNLLEKVQEQLIVQAISEGFIIDAPLLLMQPILRLVIRRHLKRKSQNQNAKSVDVSLSVNNG